MLYEIGKFTLMGTLIILKVIIRAVIWFYCVLRGWKTKASK